jgi:thiol-disulfide isomerase/thioredoxin
MMEWFRFWALSAFLIFVFCEKAVAAGTFQVSGDALAGIQLPVPQNNAAKEYLGLSGTGNFSLPGVKARTLVIEVFSMYCPICQREAPVVNELHGLIEKDISLKKDVKLVGIGIGNTPFEVEVYRKEFKVLFPLFADDSFQLQKISKDRFRTPTFIVVGIDPGATLKILDVHVGPIKDLANYLENVKKLAAAK